MGEFAGRGSGVDRGAMRVLIVDDEAPARTRLRQMLAAHADVEVAGEAETGVQAMELAGRRVSKRAPAVCDVAPLRG